MAAIRLNSLKFRIGATIFALEALMMGFTLWQVLGALQTSVAHQIGSQEQVTLDLLKGPALEALVTEEFTELQPVFESLQHDQRILRATLTNDRGRVVAAGDASALGQPGADLPELDSAYRRSIEIGRSGRVLGVLAIEFSSKALEEASLKARNLGIAIAAICMTLIAIIGVGAGWLLTRRLEQLREAASRVAAGDYSVRTGLRGKDEVAMLSQAFDQMASEVSAHQESLRRANVQLEQRVEQRTLELQDSNDQLKHALATLQRAKDELIQSEKLAALGKVVAGVAHELNTPIGNSLLAASTFSESTHYMTGALASGLRRSELNSYLADGVTTMNLIERNLGRAAALIQSFKQVAVDQSSSQRRCFDLGDIVAENIMTLQPSLKGIQVSAERQGDSSVLMDSYPGPIGQVITNLVNNAVLHGYEQRGRGDVRVKFGLAEPGWTVLEVEDDGVGIAKENLRRIFDPFFTTRFGQGGSGLGLNIVHNIVTGMLGGQIEVRSTAGKGSTFIIKLPLTAPTSAMDAPIETNPAS